MEKLLAALDNLLDASDDAGCEGDLIVTSKKALCNAVEAFLVFARSERMTDTVSPLFYPRCDRLEDYAVSRLGEDEEEDE